MPMNKKRQREISYIKLSKNEKGYSIGVQPIHAKSLAKLFMNRLVPLASSGKGVGSEDLLEFVGNEDGECLGKILQEWKERYVSGGEQYL
jgi:hypothetical protein